MVEKRLFDKDPRRFFDQLAHSLRPLGIPFSDARVFLYLYTYQPYATQDEIASFFQMAKSAVCTSLKTLQAMNFVSFDKKDGKKRYFVIISPNELINFFFERHDRFVKEIIRPMIKQRIDEIEDKDAKGMLMKRYKLHKKFFELLEEFRERIKEVRVDD